MTNQTFNPPDEIAQAATIRFPKYLTIAQAAKIVGCCYEAMRQKLHNGEITYFRSAGGSMRIPEEALALYLEENTCHAQASHQGSGGSKTEIIGTSRTEGQRIARALRMKRKPNVS